MDNIIIGGPFRVGPRLPKADQFHVDDFRIDLPAILIAEPKPRHGRGADGADDCIYILGDLEIGLLSFFVLEIEDDAALIAVRHQEKPAHPGIFHGCYGPRYISLGRFDLDDIGTIIRENLGRVGSIGDGR